MFEGESSELPAGAERRVHNGIPFFLQALGQDRSFLAGRTNSVCSRLRYERRGSRATRLCQGREALNESERFPSARTLSGSLAFALGLALSLSTASVAVGRALPVSRRRGSLL